MSKYLRHIATWPDAEVTAALGSNTVHLDWMYEYYATPYPAESVVKINVGFSAVEKREVPPVETLNIAEVLEHFHQPTIEDVFIELQRRDEGAVV